MLPPDFAPHPDNDTALIAVLGSLCREATGQEPPEPEGPPPGFVECTDLDGRNHEELVETWVVDDGRFLGTEASRCEARPGRHR